MFASASQQTPRSALVFFVPLEGTTRLNPEVRVFATKLRCAAVVEKMQLICPRAAAAEAQGPVPEAARTRRAAPSYLNQRPACRRKTPPLRLAQVQAAPPRCRATPGSGGHEHIVSLATVVTQMWGTAARQAPNGGPEWNARQDHARHRLWHTVLP